MKTIKWINMGVSIALVGLGVAAIVMTLFFQVNLAFTWPLAMILVGAAIILYAGELAQKVEWMKYLNFPGSLALVLGGIFFLNVLTHDWHAWAYAWILMIPALGWGVLLSNRNGRWPEMINVFGRLAILAGLLFFVAFGALVGGVFIQISVPLILMGGGILLYRVNEKEALIERVFERFSNKETEAGKDFSDKKEGQGMAETLTDREMQVLQLIDQGLSNGEIAERLSLAPSTVKTHINNLYGKLGVQSRVRAIRQAHTFGLIHTSNRKF